jgi:UDP-N-acetyl-2-amino-2-deoxyglucuronate dehydrogenase
VRVGIIGTGAIAHKHALAYRNIGFPVVACHNATESRGRDFAKTYGAEFVETVEVLCNHPNVDYVDLCTLPNFRLPVIELCARSGRHVLVQKPMATDLATAARMIELAKEAGIQLGVVSQHRFDDSIIFLKSAIEQGRLGRILQADAYVKWWRSGEYYSRPIKGTWKGEGGGALINQAIHQIDLLLYLIGSVKEVAGSWQLGSVHQIESEDTVNALLSYENGATGVLQASTAFWPGSSERIEVHGTNGSAIITGDSLTAWNIKQDFGEQPPISKGGESAASDPMAISVVPFERQMLDFAQACVTGKAPLCSGQEGYRALQLVRSIYEACSERRITVVQNVRGITRSTTQP